MKKCQVETMESVSLYSEARNEYLKQMSTWIVPPLVEFFRTNYLEKGGMSAFQSWCSEIPRWNQDIIEKNIETILDSVKCDYIEELMTAVFIAHTKMLTAIRISSKQKKLQITLPKLDHFLHRVFVECARIFWKAPFLFLDNLPPIETQKNILQAESMCTEALSAAVRSLLPIKSILRDYLEEDEGQEIQEVEKSKKSKKHSDSSSESDSSSDSDSDSDSEKKSKKKKMSSQKIHKESVSESLAEPISEPIDESVILPESVSDNSSEIKVEELLEPGFINTESDGTKVFQKPKTEPLVEKTEPAMVLEKVEEIQPEPVIEEPQSGGTQEINIATEPSVRFSDYETVFDETKPNISEIRYAPKLSIEEMPPQESSWDFDVPKLNVSGTAESLDLNDVEDLEPPQAPLPVQVPQQVEPQDIDAPLSSMGADFEELS
jgi:hypothetical protein